VTNKQAVLELTDVTKRYEKVGPDGPAVLDGVSLRVAAGESLAVTGPSGSGKSTLLNIIGTLDRPTSGRVVLGGRNLADLDERALAALRAREIGFVFQLHHLLPQCTVMENVLIPTLAAGGEDVAARAMSLLDRVGLADRAGDLPGRLSGGERQRVAVVRALANAPKLLLADEPTGALDRASAEGLGDLLCELNREQGVTLIVVTHAESLAGRMSRALDLRDGSLAPRALP